MGEKISRSPLKEAVCQFRFTPSQTWDWTVPGQLFDKIKGEFSEKSQIQGLKLLLPKTSEEPNLQTGPERVQLKRPDGSAMVQVGPHMLAINHLKPYPHWENFRELILKVLNTYSEIVNPFEIATIGLRYINQIEVPEGSFNIENFITLDPRLSGALKRPLATFYQRYELTHDDPKGVLVHQSGYKNPSRPPLVLDLDFVSQGLEGLDDVAKVAAWLNSAHDRVHESFVSSLTTEYYNQLK